MMRDANPYSALGEIATNALRRKAAHFIDGQWLVSAEILPVIDPATGRTVSEIGRGGPAEIDIAVAAAKQAFHAAEWRQGGAPARERLLLNLADLIEQHAADIAQVEVIDNGMPFWMARDLNVMGSAGVYRYFAGWPTKLAGQTMDVAGPPGIGACFGYTRREPLGVIGAIVPWNVPFMMAAWKLAPALAAGCTVVLKPAEDTSLSALLLADLVEKAGFPKGVFNVVTGLGAEAGEALASHPDVAKISFTGSTATGRRIGQIAAGQIKRTTLELGGKSPTIIFEDASLVDAVQGAADSIFLNSGQICVAGSRLYVHAPIFDAVVEKLSDMLPTLRVGGGFEEGVFMGPLVSARHRERVCGYVNRARRDGLTVIAGNAPESTGGFFVPPHIVIGANSSSEITREEVFGPVLSIYRFEDDDEVITKANETEYGLAASVWSTNFNRIMNITQSLQCGKVSVNIAGFPYPALPEGGFKASGYGRDLGQEAVEQCLQTKTILMRTN